MIEPSHGPGWVKYLVVWESFHSHDLVSTITRFSTPWPTAFSQNELLPSMLPQDEKCRKETFNIERYEIAFSDDLGLHSSWACTRLEKDIANAVRSTQAAMIQSYSTLPSITFTELPLNSIVSTPSKAPLRVTAMPISLRLPISTPCVIS